MLFARSRRSSTSAVIVSVVSGALVAALTARWSFVWAAGLENKGDPATVSARFVLEVMDDVFDPSGEGSG